MPDAVAPLTPDFDSLWDFNDPAATEAKFRALLPEVEASGDAQAHAELLTQIARALGLQRRFDDAHALLDLIVPILSDDTGRAAVRYQLERGRVFNSSGMPREAQPYFEQAYELALDADEDYYAVDAAHMLATVESGGAAVDWNLRAIDIASKSGYLRSQKWLGSLYNNLGWAYFDQGSHIDALSTFRQALAWQESHGSAENVRIAQWCVARTLRALGQAEEALKMQQALLAVYAGEDPIGFTEEEIGECLLALDRPDEARLHFAKAHARLSSDPWLTDREPARVERLASLASGAATGGYTGEADDAMLMLAVEENYIALFRQLAESLGGVLERYETHGRHSTFPDDPMFNGVWRGRMTEESADAVIAETLDWFRFRGVSSVFWWTDDNTTPADFGQRLIAHGFMPWDAGDAGFDSGASFIDQGAPVMVADMLQFKEALMARAPAGFTIRRVETEADLQTFGDVFQMAAEPPAQSAQAWVNATLHAGISRAPWRLYVGWLGAAPVATAIVVEGGGIASVWGVSTLPEARRKGIGAAITLGSLLEARVQGYRYAGLVTTAIGASIYGRIGFRHAGKLIRYLWRSPEA